MQDFYLFIILPLLNSAANEAMYKNLCSKHIAKPAAYHQEPGLKHWPVANTLVADLGHGRGLLSLRRYKSIGGHSLALLKEHGSRKRSFRLPWIIYAAPVSQSGRDSAEYLFF